MDLYDYFYMTKKETGLTVGEFAEKLGCTRGHAQGLISGKHHPSFNMAIKIEEVTGGKVKKWEALKYACDRYDRKETLGF